MNINVSKTIDGVKHEHTVTYDFGKDIDEMTKKFGPEVVFNNARQSMVITLQSRLRAKITEPLAVLEKIALEWVPGIIKPKKSKVDKAKSILKDMSEDEIAAILKQYQ